MPDFVPPGAPPAETLNVNSDLLEEFARSVELELESSTVGKIDLQDDFTTVEAAVPGAELINGCIGISQTVEPLVTDLYDSLNQLYLDIHAGISVIKQQDADNAAQLGRTGGR